MSVAPTSPKLLTYQTLDATGVLRAEVAAHREIFHRSFDPHFNLAGHRLIAEWIHDSWPHTAETGLR